MTITHIYHHYRIPPNLQTHMLRVTAVGLTILESWKTDNLANGSQPSQWLPAPKPDTVIITQVLLLHDMGNIIKFNLDTGAHLLGEEAKNIDYWKQVQQDFITKYGPDEHLATSKIASELKTNDQVLKTLANIGSSKLHILVNSDDWYPKLCTYADMRVGPFGVISINERFDDVIKRYKDSTHPLSDIAKTEQKRQYALQLEKQIQEQISFPLKNFNETTISQTLHQLKTYSFLPET